MAVRDENAKQSCLLGCAATGGLVGVAAMVLLFFVGEEYGSAASIFLGGLAGIVVSLLMMHQHRAHHPHRHPRLQRRRPTLSRTWMANPLGCLRPVTGRPTT